MQRWVPGLLATVLLLSPVVAAAEIPRDKITIGIMNTGAGPALMRTAHGLVTAAQMAAEDFAAGARTLDVDVEAFDSDRTGDAVATVRDWLAKDHIDAVIDVAGGSAAARIAALLRAHDRTYIVIDMGGPGLAAAVAGPTTVLWGADSAALARSVVHVLVGQHLASWYLLAGAGPLPQALADDASRFLLQSGGRVTGRADPPFGEGDFGQDLRRADGADAQVIALAETGPDLDDAVAASARLGLAARHRMAALFAPLDRIDRIGLQAAQGMVAAEPFYWDHDAATRDFTDRFRNTEGQRMPTATEAEMYAATTALLNAAAAARSIAAENVLAALRRGPISDRLLGTVTVRPDGVAMHDITVYRVKRPGESMQRWDDLAPLATVPAAIAFAPSAP